MNSEIRRILVPLDGSPQAEASLEAIKPFVGTNDPEVILLGVHEVPTVTPAYLYSACNALRSNGVKASVYIREGKAAEEILACARETKVDLVAMSTHGRTGLQRILMGSVTEAVLRRTEVPLLVSRPGMGTGPWKRIVVALDGSKRAEAILPDAARLARILKASLDLVQVALPVVVGSGLGEVPLAFPGEDPMPYLKEVCGRLAAEGVEGRPVGLDGRAASEVLRHAQQVQAGLICMTTHGRTGLPRFLLGSIAEEILRLTPCPVLIRRAMPVRQRAKAQASKT